MDMSIKSNNNDIINIIIDSIMLFDEFDEVYIFGSILNPNKFSNDVDLLLLYSTFSSNLVEKEIQISEFLEKISGCHLDITVLSFEEEKDINFIDRLNYNYIMVK